ncbi:Peptide-N4-(N-acetyl-beta-glucosaminyl)asparagineamidase A [Linum perenne]
MQSFLFLTLQSLLILLVQPTQSSISPDRFLRPQSPPSLSESHKPQQFIELAHPLPSDKLTPPSSPCTLHVIHHSFADTIGGPPFSTAYHPPIKCSFPWSHVALELRVTSRGDQYDRISGLWLGGSEILRTSTAEPTSQGIFWKVRKDITRYTSLLLQTNLNLTMMLENIVNDVYTGVYHVDVFFLFYRADAVSAPFRTGSVAEVRVLQEESGGLGAQATNESPADLIIPISSSNGYEKGFWFVIDGESDVHSKEVRFPPNTRKAVLELYISFHGNDEFWYSNPLNSYIRVNNLTTARGNGAYREVFVTIDGKVVASEVPFPVVFTGGINPLFWNPVVAIGAFNLPSYDHDLSPVLGLVLDGKAHTIGVGVSDGISYWLVDANLHIWLDGGSSKVEAKSVVHDSPASYITREEEFHLLDGSFEIKGKRRTLMVGWVKWSGGNHTTSVSQEYKFRSIISFKRNGTMKTVNQRIKVKKEVTVRNELDELVSRVKIKRRYPIKMISATLPGSKPDTYLAITNVSHAFLERHVNGEGKRNVYNKQVSNGWMEVKDHDVLDGGANTNQTLRCRDDELSCFVWSVSAVDGKLVKNDTSSVCPSVYVKIEGLVS